MHNISRSKNNQLMEYNKKNIFFKNHTQNEAGRPVSDLFLFLKKALYEVKTSGLQPSFIIYR